MELSKSLEAVTSTAANIGRFVFDQLRGGAWGDLADSLDVPVKANLTYYSTGDPNVEQTT